MLTFAIVTLCGEAARAAPNVSVQRWIFANEHAIAGLHNAKNQTAARQRFMQARKALVEQERQSVATLPSQNPQQLARTILSNARLYKFMRSPAPYRRSWWERALDWLGERWSRLMRAIFGRANVPAPVSRGVADVLLVASVLVFIILLARVVWLYGRRSQSKVAAQPLRVPDDPWTLLAAGMSAAEGGDYVLAVAHLFAAAIALLMMKKRFEGRPSETVRELSRRISSDDPRLREPFDELTDGLTRAVYAEHPLARADWSRSLGAYHRLESLLQS